MSAIGNRTAIVSLGHSCQSSRQIDANIRLLRQLTKDSGLQKASLPFDWIIATADGIAGLFEDGCFFPETAEGLVDDQGRLRHRTRDVLYWHESRALARTGNADFENAKAKFRHTSDKFRQIAGLDRVVAVFSDTQPNLPEIEHQWKFPLVGTSPDSAERARAAFADFLGRPVELLMVGRLPRPEATPRPGFAYYHVVPDTAGWAGNGRHWTAVFGDYFSARGPSKRACVGSIMDMDDQQASNPGEVAAATLARTIVQSMPGPKEGASWDEKTVLDTYRRCFRFVRNVSADPRYRR